MKTGGLIFLILILILLFIILFCFSIYKKYKNYVLKTSQAIIKLIYINNNYNFYPIKKIDLINSYDNEFYYNSISPEDYLIYELVFIKNEVSKVISQTRKNYNLYKEYRQDILNNCVLGKINKEKFLFKSLIDKIEYKLFLNYQKTPIISFSILVELILTNINNEFRSAKKERFNEEKILSLISGVRNKNGYYNNNNNNKNIWDAIVRVERGKVSNKMRFSIYNRDGNRCISCGSTDNLEIDHIIPISKGGKSTYDNLQTLCRYCNKAKGNNTYYKL